MSQRKNIRRVESAVLTRNVASTLDAVETTGLPVIITRRGRARVAIVPLIVELGAADVARMVEDARREVE